MVSTLLVKANIGVITCQIFVQFVDNQRFYDKL